MSCNITTRKTDKSILFNIIDYDEGGKRIATGVSVKVDASASLIAQARNRAAVILDDYINGKLKSRDNRNIRLDEFAKVFFRNTSDKGQTLYQKKLAFDKLRKKVGNVRVTDLGNVQIDSLKKHMQELTYENKDKEIKRQNTDTTINKTLTKLKTIFKWGMANNGPLEFLRVNPFADKGVMISKPVKLEVGILTAQNVVKIKNHMATREGLVMRLIWWMAYKYGARRSEIMNLRKNQIDWEAGKDRKGIIRMKNWKTGEPISAPIFDDIRGMLMAVYDQAGEGEYIFQEDGIPLDHDKVSRRFHKIYYHHLGLKGIKPLHGSRHTIGTRYMEEGGDLFALQSWLGHATIESTKQYIHGKRLSLADDFENLTK